MCVSKAQNTKEFFFSHWGLFPIERAAHFVHSVPASAGESSLLEKKDHPCRRSVPEVLDVVLYSAEAQSVGQGLVVGQSLSWWAPVHIWREGHTQAETHSAV